MATPTNDAYAAAAGTREIAGGRNPSGGVNPPPPPPPPPLPNTDYIALEPWEVTRTFYHRSAGVRWVNNMGDWFDAEGTAQGNVPFDQGGAAAGVVQLDVTGMLANWSGVTLRSIGGYIEISSMEGADPPYLIVDGQEIPAYGDVEIASSTSANIDGRTVLQASGASNVIFMDFDVPDGAQSATLVVQKTRGPGQIQVYRTAAPVLNAWRAKPKVYGIGQGKTIAELNALPAVIAAWDWSGDWLNTIPVPEGYGGLAPNAYLSEPVYKTIDGETWVGLKFRAATVCGVDGASSPSGIRYEFKPVPATIDPDRPGGGGIDHCFMQYEFISRFDVPESDPMLDGGKFPGFDGRYGYPANGGAYWQPVVGNGGSPGYGRYFPEGVAGRDFPVMGGWSARGQWLCEPSPDGPLQDAIAAGSYMYHPGWAVSGTGDVQMWDTGVVFMPGVKHTIEHEIRINTISGPFDAAGNGVGNPDGIHRIWVDGRLVRDRTDFIFTHHPYINIHAAWLTFQHGGVRASCSEQNFDFGPIVLATEYIGPREIEQYNVPEWRQNLTDGVWTQIGSNTVSSIDPELSAVHNPNYPAAAPWGADNWESLQGPSGRQTRIVDAWGGGVLDTDNERYVIWGGGHNDYLGNESYYIDLKADNPTWVMPRAPSGSLTYDPTFVPDAGDESAPTPLDQPRSAHSYGKIAYIPEASSMEGAGRVILVTPGNTSPGGSASDGRTYLLNIATGVFENMGNLGVSPYLHPSAEYIAPVDGVLSIGDNEASMVLYSGDPLAATDLPWPQTQVIPSAGMPPPMYIDSKGVVLALWGVSGAFIGLLKDPDDLNSSAALQYATIDPTNAPILGTHMTSSAGAVWVPQAGKVYVWDNLPGFLNNIWSLTPPAGDPFTGTWTWQMHTVSGMTGARANTGTYGRFRYSARYNCLYLLNDTRERIWALALPQGGL